MQEIKCPNCGEVFQVDESGYNQIVQQVRDREFQKELEGRTRELLNSNKRELEVIRLEQEKAYDASIKKKDNEISQRDQLIAKLQGKLNLNETEKELAVSKALEKQSDAFSKEADAFSKQLSDKDEVISQRDKTIIELREKLNSSESAKKLAVAEALEQRNREFSKESNTFSRQLADKDDAISDRDKTIVELREKLNSSENAKKLAVAEAIERKNEELSQRATEIADLKGELKSKETEYRLSEKSLQEKYDEKLRLKDEEIDYYKDFKARQSTKMIGESLEMHCLTQFNAIRMTAFPCAYFEKDSDARTGSKGDFIYREADENGIEFISIMFEMKNEADTTATKHKNEDFFKELDKDRREKGCEYAILVSLLEIDNELYNNGIVDVSYRYPKMYVIRPQFFIPMITLLRNAARNTLSYRQELQRVQSQQLDITQFENNMNDFKERFGRNYRIASEKFQTAIEEIDKTITHLQKTKDALLSSENNLRLANNKAEELSIKRLTKNAPSVRAMFDELKREE